MKTLFVKLIGAVPSLATGVSFAQNGNMMNDDNSGMWGGWMGGYGGMLVPAFLAIVVVGLVVWVVTRQKK